MLDGVAGLDRVSYKARTSSLNITLDAAANDGSSDERENVIGVEEAEAGRVTTSSSATTATTCSTEEAEAIGSWAPAGMTPCSTNALCLWEW